MPIQKSISSNPYGSNGPYDLTGTPPFIEDNAGLEEYRPIAALQVTKVYLTTNLPVAASGNLGFVVWVYDAPAGTQLQFSDGSAWQVFEY